MKTINLVQGGPEWHAHRDNPEIHNASDAPAMLNCSPYKTRNELIRERATGIKPEVDDATQRRFDDGHTFEALARPLAEAIIGEELYPVIGVEGSESASFDGLTMLGDIAFEHKSLNDDLRAVMVEGCTGADLPKHYRVQMEQQCMVSGCEKVLFMASKWKMNTDTGEYELVEKRHCWYFPDLALRDQITLGWKQFDADLAAYVPQPVKAEVVAAPVETLPAIVYQIDRATMALTSNLPDFRAAAESMVERTKLPLVTDQDFADREALCKAFVEAEKLLKMKAEEVIGQIEDVARFSRELGDIAELFRTARLASEKLVDAEKKNRRAAIQQAGEKALADHIAALQARFAGRVPMPATRGEFAGAIKGKRTLTSIQDAVDAELAKRKIEANHIADGIDANLRALDELAPDHGFLFRDLPLLVTMPAEAFRATVEGRVAAHKAQEQARIEAEVQAKLAAEKAAQQQAEAEATRMQEDRPKAQENPAPVSPERVAPQAAASDQSLPPTDQQVIYVAINAVAVRYGLSTTAAARLLHKAVHAQENVPDRVGAA